MGADYNLAIFDNVTAANRVGMESLSAVGSNDQPGGAGHRIINNGRLYVDRLVNSATRTTSGRALFPVSQTFLGLGLGTAAAHEIGHFLLQQGKHSTTGLMRPGFNGTEWFG